MTSRSVSDDRCIHPMDCACDHCAPKTAPVALPVAAAIWTAVVLICALLGPDRLIFLFAN